MPRGRIGHDASGVACYVAVGEQVAVLETWRKDRADFCNTVVSEGQAACRFGAGLTDDVPRGLQRPEWFRRPVN